MTFRWNWSARADNLGVAVLAHRALARGHAVHLTDTGYRGPDALAHAALQLPIDEASAPHERADEAHGTPLRLPRVVLYAGDAIGYPYYAYYSHALWSLGLTYRRASAQDIADGMLDTADLFIIPGGFATWGLDRVEGIAGIDRAIAGFLARGGACIGSCGGAYYLSQGRPGWLGAIDAKPRYTHEYLLTGTCLLNLQIDDARLRRDLPASLELPYYHGPVYDASPRASATLATFGEFVFENRLFIDNPIDAARYDTTLRGRAAVLAGRSPAHRVIGFSAHPEMGEFLRKGMALDQYIRKYLPIRGEKTMDETLRFYAQEDCIAFRLILNAALMLGAFDSSTRQGTAPLSALPPEPAGENHTESESPARLPDWAISTWHDALARLRARLPKEEDAAFTQLLERELQRLEAEWTALANDAALARELAREGELLLTLRDAMTRLAVERVGSAPETLVMLEMPVRLASAWRRMAHYEATIGDPT